MGDIEVKQIDEEFEKLKSDFAKKLDRFALFIIGTFLIAVVSFPVSVLPWIALGVICIEWAYLKISYRRYQKKKYELLENYGYALGIPKEKQKELQGVINNLIDSHVSKKP